MSGPATTELFVRDCDVQGCQGNDQPSVLCGMEVTDPTKDGLVVHFRLCTEHFPLWAAWVAVVRDPRMERPSRRRRGAAAS